MNVVHGHSRANIYRRPIVAEKIVTEMQHNWYILNDRALKTHSFAFVQERRKHMLLEGMLLDGLRVSTHALHKLHQELASHRRIYERGLFCEFLRQSSTWRRGSRCWGSTSTTSVASTATPSRELNSPRA